MNAIEIYGEWFDRDTSHFSFPFDPGRQYDMEELAKLQALPALESASFGSTNFDDLGIKMLAKHCPHLNNLNLQDTQVSDHGIKYLSKLKQLEILRLKENDQLSNRCVSGLNLIRSLVDLQIHETSIDLEGLEELHLIRLNQLLVSAGEDYSKTAFLRLSSRLPQCNILVKSCAEFHGGQVVWER